MTSGVLVRETDDGVLVQFRVVPRAGRSEVDGVHDGAIRVRLKAPPVDGAANRELCQFVAKRLKIRRGDVAIVSGDRSRTKTLAIRGATREQILESLLPN